MKGAGDAGEGRDAMKGPQLSGEKASVICRAIHFAVGLVIASDISRPR